MHIVTGGDAPTPEFENCEIGKILINFFIQDQINDCGGINEVQEWLFGGSLEEKLNIINNRAKYDAWATYRNFLIKNQTSKS